ncbi:MAG: DUF5677 domain-containing protein [Treponema sp.]|jgi:hypothetical protein|nr:DUF5677 domain-containing protein [Treponema sp.]
MEKNGDSKGENFTEKCKNVIFNFIAEYIKENESVKNNAERTLLLVKRYATKLKADFDISENKVLPYKYFLFFSDILSGCYEYLENYFKEKILNEYDENSLLILKYKNALQSFKTISYVMQTNDFSSSLILFRVLYENMVILKFLLSNVDCIGEFDEYSMIKLTKLYDIYGSKTTGIKKLSKINNSTYQLDRLDIENKLKKNYDWAKQKIKKGKGDINFHDIETEVFREHKFIKENMIKKYNLISDLTHANTSIFTQPDKDVELFNLLLDCFEQMGFPLMVDTFLTLFKFVYNGQFQYKVEAFNKLFFALFPYVYGK